MCVCGGEWSDIGDRNGGKQAVRLLGESQMQIDASVPEAPTGEAEARGEDVLDASAGEAAVQTESVPEAPVGEAEEGSRFEIKRHKPYSVMPCPVQDDFQTRPRRHPYLRMPPHRDMRAAPLTEP